MKNNTKILRSELQKELDALSKIYADFSEAVKLTPIDNFSRRDLRIVGSIFHDFYTCIEKAFKKIATHIDEELPKETAWHSNLLDRMALRVADLRPAVISDDLKNDLYDFLRFRHVVRNVYGFELDLKKVLPLIDSFADTYQKVKEELNQFMIWLKEMD
jgi:hypothetical protein